jgi:hypothetical protein
MLVLHRLHLPRLIGVSIAAAILSIAMSLVLAGSLSKIDRPGHDTGPVLRETAPAFTPQTTAPRSASNRSLFSQPLSPPWPISSDQVSREERA